MPKTPIAPAKPTRGAKTPPKAEVKSVKNRLERAETAKLAKVAATSKRNVRKDVEEGVVDYAPAVITNSRTTFAKLPSVLFSPAYKELCAEIAKVNKSVGVSTSNLVQVGHVKNAISTGCLSFDFVCGGGIAPGRFTITPGREGSGKSTLVNTLAARCVLQGTPVAWFDAETALSADYAAKIFGRFGIRFSDLLGIPDPKRPGMYEVPPIIHYYDEVIGERVFKTMHGIMKALPTIRQGSDGTYWKLIVGKTKTEWVEDEREGAPQMLFIEDSIPALLPESIDENPDKSPMAVQARMLSECLKLVKGLFAQKNCTFIATNQLRLNPGVRMGDPTYEPGGQAVMFYSDNRTRIMKVSPNTAGVPSGAGAKFSEEPGLFGGTDQYIYSKVQNTKNKAFAPFRESTLRIRFQKDGQPGDGICETWDCANYLQATGQMTQKGNTMTMNLMPVKHNGKMLSLFQAGERITRHEFKRRVESPEFKHAVYNFCSQQMRCGYGFDLEREAVKKIVASEVEKVAPSEVEA